MSRTSSTRWLVPIRGLALVAALAVSGAAGCERAVFGPGRFDADLRGRYDGSFLFEWEPVGPGSGGWDEDAGTISIRYHRGSSFDGDWSWWVDGYRYRGDLDRGRHDRHRGDVTFELESDFGFDPLEEVTGCRFVSGDRDFYGFASGRRLEAERVARFRCVDPRSGFRDDMIFRLSFSGWR